MKARDIKTLISSGTIIIAVGLYLIFGNKPPTEEEYTKQQSQQQQEEVQPPKKSEVAIPLAEAEKLTGNRAQKIEYVSANDGDTFSIKLDGKKQRVRLLMLDTPEMNYDKGEPMPYAEDAKAFTIDLLKNAKEIDLLFDKGPETDNYDRLLAYVYVDGVLLQEALLQQGLGAMRYVNAPNDTLEEPLRAVQRQAEQASVNIWSHDGYFANNRFNKEAVK